MNTACFKKVKLYIRLFITFGCILVTSIWSTGLQAQQQNLPSNQASFFQKIDVTPFQDRPFRLHAAVKVYGSTQEQTQARLYARVILKDENIVYVNEMEEHLITDSVWSVYTIEGTIDPDAGILELGGIVKENGTFYFDAFQLQSFTFYPYKAHEDGSPCFGEIHDIFHVQADTLWLSTDCGLVLFDLISETCFRDAILVDNLPAGEVDQVIRDDEGEFWISVSHSGGIYRYNLYTGDICPVWVRFQNGFTVKEPLMRPNYLGNGMFFFFYHYNHLGMLYNKYKNSFHQLPFANIFAPWSISKGTSEDIWTSTGLSETGVIKVNREMRLLLSYVPKAS